MIFDKYVRALATLPIEVAGRQQHRAGHPSERGPHKSLCIPKPVRVLAAAALLALAIVSVPTEFAHAKVHKTKASCEAAGYFWHHTEGCADQTCTYRGTPYWPGEGIRVFGRYYACNGVTGEWVAVRTAQPDGPVAPTNAPVGPAWGR